MTEGDGGTPSVAVVDDLGGAYNPPNFDEILNENGCPVVSKIRDIYFHHIDYYLDLDLALELYKFYRDHPDYVILYKFAGDDEPNYVAIKASKRGNVVYLYRIKQRLKPYLDHLKKNNIVFAGTDRHKIYTTHFLFVNLTFDCSPLETYEKANGIKEFLDLLRKHFGKVYVVAWGLDLQQSGKLHYDAVLYFPSGIRVRWWFSPHRNKHILVLVNEYIFRTIKEKWKHGYCNIEGVASLKDAILYCLKYVLKSTQNDLLNTIGILYRKRNFYIAPKKIFDLFLDLRLDSDMNNCDHYIFIGIYPCWCWGLDPRRWFIKFKAPPPEEVLGHG